MKLDPFAKRVVKTVTWVVIVLSAAIILGPLWWMAPLGYFLALLAIRRLSISDDGYIEDKAIRELRKELRDK